MIFINNLPVLLINQFTKISLLEIIIYAILFNNNNETFNL